MFRSSLLKSPGNLLTLLVLVVLPIIIVTADFSTIKTATDIKQEEFDELNSLENELGDLNDLDIDPALLAGLDNADLDLSLKNITTDDSAQSNNKITEKESIASAQNKKFKAYLILTWGILLIALFLINAPTEHPLRSQAQKLWTVIENDTTFLFLGLLLLFTMSSLLEKSIHIELSSSEYLTHSVIIVALLGAALAFRNREHISLTIVEYIIPKNKQQPISIFTTTITAIILFTFLFSSLSWPRTYGPEKALIVIKFKHIIPLLLTMFGLATGHAKLRKYNPFFILLPLASVVALIALFKYPFECNYEQSELTLALYKFLYVIPFGLFVITMRATLQKNHNTHSLIPITIGIITPLITKLLYPTELPDWALYVAIGLLLAGTFLGVPIFTILTGFAMVFIYNEAHGTLVRVLDESYGVLTLEEYATIPLFTISGFLLSFSKSGERLIRFFKALFGPIPGGIAIVAVLVSAFFTTFTGASGVTILALGGLLHYIMTQDGYSEKFTTGYLTSSGSIGLLFPPALPIILFGVQAKVSIIKLFAGGFLPGILLISSISLYGVYTSKKIKNRKKIAFDAKEVFVSFKAAIFEILLPGIIIYLFFSGKAVIVETAAFSVIYLLVVQLFIHKDIKTRQLPEIFTKAASVAGSVLIILIGAKALSSQIIYAQIPQQLTEWCQANIHHKWTFLLILNIGLLITGFFMDIFSAIMVVVPLILPISEAFGIDPVHLGIIFLANLEVGYLTPPVGLNLFLSALTFKQSLIKIYRSVLPFLVIMIIAVFIITYVPALTSFGVSMGDKLGLYGDEKQKTEQTMDKTVEKDALNTTPQDNATDEVTN